MVNPKQQSLAPGLYLVATPIGTARDITLRTLDILGAADVIAAEDTRSLRKLMDIHGISPGDRPVLAYHDHNGEKMRPRLLAALAEGSRWSTRPRRARRWWPIRAMTWRARQWLRAMR